MLIFLRKNAYLKQYKEDLSDMHKFYIAEVTSILVDESYEG